MGGGAYGELRRALNDPSMVVHPMPPLGIFFYGMESQKGSPLTEEEVRDLLEIAPAITIKVEHRDQLIELRGPFGHLDPDNIWEEWLKFREIANREWPAND